MSAARARVSPEAVDLARQVAQLFLEQPGDLVSELDAAVTTAAAEPLRGEPTLTAELTSSTHENVLHWATSMAQDPLSRVPVELSPLVIDIVRETFRRGLEQTLLTTYHAGQNIVSAHWIRLAFSLSRDPAVLQQVVEIGSRSTAAYADDMLAALSDLLESEHAALAQGSDSERFEVVCLVLDGGPVTARRASSQLGYDLDRPNTAAILWTDTASPDQAALAQGAELLARVIGARQILRVIASSSSIWVWLADAAETEAGTLLAQTTSIPEIRVAVGSTETGIEGFRNSHVNAVTTQRLMSRLPHLRVAKFADVQIVALVTRDEQRACEFVARTLGKLATADPELRDTLRTYIREEFSASHAARALYAHRNTVLNRLQRAERMLPLPLAGHGLEVGLALEIDHWLRLGTVAPSSPPGLTGRGARPGLSSVRSGMLYMCPDASSRSGRRRLRAARHGACRHAARLLHRFCTVSRRWVHMAAQRYCHEPTATGYPHDDDDSPDIRQEPPYEWRAWASPSIPGTRLAFDASSRATRRR